jgi:hypothetical protein
MTLQTELSTDPLARGYATMNADQTLASLTAVNRPMVIERVITDRTLYSALGPAEAEAILTKLATAGASDATVNRALGWISQRDGFNIGDPVAQAMVDQLVTNGVFTAAEGASIKGLAIVTKSRADELGLSVDWGVVNSARAALGWTV